MMREIFRPVHSSKSPTDQHLSFFYDCSHCLLNNAPFAPVCQGHSTWISNPSTASDTRCPRRATRLDRVGYYIKTNALRMIAASTFDGNPGLHLFRVLVLLHSLLVAHIINKINNPLLLFTFGTMRCSYKTEESRVPAQGLKWHIKCLEKVGTLDTICTTTCKILN